MAEPTDDRIDDTLLPEVISSAHCSATSCSIHSRERLVEHFLSALEARKEWRLGSGRDPGRSTTGPDGVIMQGHHDIGRLRERARRQR